MKIHWGRAWAGALIAEIAQIAAAFLWVATYSYLINPGQPFATYEAHAQESGPWVSILAGAPIFYAASRWIARSQPPAVEIYQTARVNSRLQLNVTDICLPVVGSAAPIATPRR